MRFGVLATAVACTVAASPIAVAQTKTSPSTSPPPAATAPPAATPPATTPPAAKPVDTGNKSAAAPANKPMWYTHQANDMRASKLIGTKVVNASNENVGDINEIVLSKDGKVAAVVIGVGGFLGMGEHEVALDFNSLQIRRDNNNNLVLATSATKDSLKGAPEWKWENASK